jgi:hypothetical protein
MTKQETFDTVVRHLLTQAKQSRDEDACLYRGPDGTKCAAGCLISDADYSPSMEWLYATSIRYALVGHDMEIVMDLQLVHDERDVGLWPDELSRVALKHGLSHSIIEEMEPAFMERLRGQG